MPPPVPPSVNAGRMMSGKRPIFFATARASSEIVRDAGNRNVEADLQHQILEREAVFAFVNGFGFCADHFDVVTFERAVFVQRHRGVQRGLAAERREQNQFAFRA